MTTLYLRDDLIASIAEAPQYPSSSLYPSTGLYPGDETELCDAVIRGPGGQAYNAATKLAGGVSFTETVDALIAAALELVDETGVSILHT